MKEEDERIKAKSRISGGKEGEGEDSSLTVALKKNRLRLRKVEEERRRGVKVKGCERRGLKDRRK